MADGLSAEQRYFFDVNGYLVVEGVLPSDDVEYLNAIVEAQRVAPPGDDIGSQRFGDEFLLWDQACRDLMNHPAVLPLLRDLLGDRLRLDHAYGIVMAPDSLGLGLHGGGTPWDGSQFYLRRGGGMYSGLTTVTWALVDHEPGQGGFGCIPGSHKAEEWLPEWVPPEWVREPPTSVAACCSSTPPATWPGRATRSRRGASPSCSPRSSGASSSRRRSRPTTRCDRRSPAGGDNVEGRGAEQGRHRGCDGKGAEGARGWRRNRRAHLADRPEGGGCGEPAYGDLGNVAGREADGARVGEAGVEASDREQPHGPVGQADPYPVYAAPDMKG